MIRYLKISSLVLLFASASYAGPPFVTDDPVPVDFRHWEFYIASGQSFSKTETEATLPHFEINYGIVHEVQMHLILPVEYTHTPESSRYGLTKIEFGVKYRFLKESESYPQIGIFPIVELPTEMNSIGTGDKQLEAFFPVWLQKSWGDFTTYGGGGYWVNPGSDKKNWILPGWEVQYDFSESLMLGGEIYYQSADEVNSSGSSLINLGGCINFGDSDHLLLSVGHTFTGEKTFTGYIAYQLTI